MDRLPRMTHDESSFWYLFLCHGFIKVIQKQLDDLRNDDFKKQTKNSSRGQKSPYKIIKKENPEQRLESKQQAKVIKFFGEIKHGEKHE